MMATLIRCPECGARYDPARGGGLCPACALGCAQEPEEPDPHNDDAGPAGRFAGHDLLEEIARGGMGIVYRARQRHPERDVALKCLPGLASVREAARERFRQEARALATLEHPAILPIFHFGEQDGVPFFTMKLAGGGALRERLSDYRGRWHAIAGLMRTVAEAVQFAHDHAVLHRDLKPGNLLFDNAGRVLVADFGLAQFADAAPPEHMPSRFGTPAYLAPEIQRGEAFTAASDVWSLGAVLYELLAQRPLRSTAFPGTETDLLDPSDLSHPAWPPGIPRDLAAIAAKALAATPAHRYHSARERAEDLRRWRQGHPVHARPASWPRRLGYWARRNPLLAASATVFAGALAAFLLLQWRAQRELRAALGESLRLEARHLRVLDQPEEALERVRRAAALLPASALPALRTEAAALLALPSWPLQRRWTVPHVALTGTHAFSPELSHYLTAAPSGDYLIHDTATGTERRRIQSETSALALRFQAEDGFRRVVSLHEDGSTELRGGTLLWSHRAADWSQRVAPALHPDGVSFLHASTENGAWLGTPDLPETRLVAPAPAAPHPVSLDPSGTRAFLIQGASRQAGLWPVEGTGDPLILREATPQPAQAVWSPNGRRLALVSATAPYAVQVFDATTGRLVREFYDHQLGVAALAWHPDSESFATMGADLRLVWRSLAPGGFRLARPAAVRALGFSSDGKTIGFSPADGSLGLLSLSPSPVFRLWPAPGGEDPGQPQTFRAALSPDAAWTALIGRTHLSLWETAARREITRWPLPVPANWAEVKFLGDDLCFAVVNERRLRKTSPGSLQRGEIPALLGGENTMLLGVAPDEPALVVSEARGEERSIWLWPEGDPARALHLAGGFPMIGYRLLPGHRLGFTTHWNEPDLWLWNADTGQRLRGLGLAEAAASEPSPDGRWLLTGTARENILWDTATWQRAATWPATPGEHETFTAAFSPDGTLLAKALPGGLIELRTVPGGQPVLTLTPPSPCRILHVLFHPGGGLLYGVQFEGRLLEWDLAALRLSLEKWNLAW